LKCQEGREGEGRGNPQTRGRGDTGMRREPGRGEKGKREMGVGGCEDLVIRDR